MTDTINTKALADALDEFDNHNDTDTAAYRAADELRRLLSENAELRAECDALRPDALRHRWLKSRPVECPTEGPDLVLWADGYGHALRGPDADAAIDAAMKG